MKIPKFFFFISLLLLVHCNKADNPTTPYDANLSKAESFDTIKQYKKAFFYYSKSYEYNQNINHRKRMVYCLLKQAEIQTIFCDYNGAQENVTKVTKFFDESIAADYRENALIVLGTSYLNLDNHDESLKIYYQIIDSTSNALTKV